MNRRTFLATVGTVAGVSAAGCMEVIPSNKSEGEGDTIEIIVSNNTDEIALIGVRIEDNDDEPLFTRVYEIEPGHDDESAGIETRPSTMTAFTSDGMSKTWEYAPDTDSNCDGIDIWISLTPNNTITSRYAC